MTTTRACCSFNYHSVQPKRVSLAKKKTSEITVIIINKIYRNKLTFSFVDGFSCNFYSIVYILQKCQTKQLMENFSEYYEFKRPPKDKSRDVS